MGYFCPPHQVAEAAMRAETGAIVFYEKLAALSESPREKEIFAGLADQERGHRDFFKSVATKWKSLDAAHEYSVDICRCVEDGISKTESVIESLPVAGMKRSSFDILLELAFKMEEKFSGIYRELHDSLVGELRGPLAEILKAEEAHLAFLRKLIESRKKNRG